MHFTYLALLLFTLSYPLYKSFEEKIRFHTKFRFLFPGILLSAAFFILWDIRFTQMGVWQFHDEFILGWKIAGLPIEEWLFFLITPFSCMFIYEVMLYFVKNDPWKKAAPILNLSMILVLSGLAVVYHDRIYTLVICTLVALFLFIHQFLLRSSYLGNFYLAWAVCILPFLLVNGVLTSMPVVTYAAGDIIGFRIFTIPIEDLFYGMLNILQVLTIYETLKQKAILKS